ncbi:MAG TPA: protein-glutamine glutaminase family protein [Polyangiaceae bacterium]|nr:protein-glutamine glutaminase family protein [Polyangiaceae bacterium]
MRNLSTAVEGDVYSHRATLAELNFAEVPTWSDADISAQFARARDDRYLTQFDSTEPNFPRRMSWLYPDDGCFARAEQVDVRVAQAGKARPYKLFAFGNPLRVYTDNASGGMVEWGYHVVPVVKNSAGEPIVFDPALSPCKPLPYKQWLALMVEDMADYDNVAGRFGVALADSGAYYPTNLASGEPPHSAESLNDLQGYYLSAEWSRQTELGRDPTVVLGEQPPWSGDACRGE